MVDDEKKSSACGKMKEWDQFLEAEEKILGKEVVGKWLKPLKIVNFDAANLYLDSPTEFHTVWFEEHMRKKLRKSFQTPGGRPIKVHLSPSKQKKVFKPTLNLIANSIDSACTFETYVGNELSAKMLKEAVEKKNYNPIYIYGPPGVGKTHLLMAAAQFLQACQLSCFYVRAETFTEHVVAAIRSGAMEKFRKLYRKADVLLFDDAHLLSGKTATQEEFFHTFNTLHTLGKPILLASAAAPQMLSGIEPRLVSRFEWGLVLPLHKLHLSELEALLAQRMQTAQFSLSSAGQKCLLSNFERSPKTLVRALDALILRCHLDHLTASDLSSEKAAQLLSKLIEEEKKILLTPVKIVHTVAQHYGTVSAEDLLGKSQTQECALPRQISMFLCRHLLKMPFVKIGEVFNRDHSTVMSSVRLVQKKIEGRELSLDFICKKLQT